MLRMVLGCVREREMPVLRFADLYHSRVPWDMSTSMKTVTEQYRTAV